MRFRILGPFEATDAGGAELALGGAKQRALLALLLLNAGEVVSTDRIVEEIWGPKPPAKPAHTVQVYISNLRKALGELGRELLITRPPGYVLELPADSLDLSRFERALNEGRTALAEGKPAEASARLREGLDEWRGPPLAEFAYEAFAQAAIARLLELRLVAHEERIEADLATGQHGNLVPELQQLVSEQPLRERPRAQLMIALYRSGRQAEALDVFQETRATLVEHLGIDPSPTLQALERQILNQDPALALAEAPALPEAEALSGGATRSASPVRSILCAPSRGATSDALIALAEPLSAAEPPHELVIARLVDASTADDDLATATAQLNDLRRRLDGRGVRARAAAFTTLDVGDDLIRLASEQDVDLLLADVRVDELTGSELPPVLGSLFDRAPCDVAVLLDTGAGRVAATGGDPVLVPFGASEHDWAALELGAWLAASTDAVLRLMGSLDGEESGRDASRLLAHAALAVQGLIGVATEPVLVEGGTDALIDAASGASVVLLGLGETWRKQGVGELRTAAAARLDVPAVIVRRGLRPGGLSSPENLTRFNWSLGGG